MATTTTPDLLDPTAPKKTPTVSPSALGPGVQGPSAGGAAMPSAVDTGITPAATPAPASAPAPAPAPAPVAAPVDIAPAAAPATASPTGVTAQQGVAALNDAAERRLGRPLTNQEVQMLAQRAGPPQGPNGTYTQAQLDGALETVSRYSGNLATPFGALPESAPGSTTNQAAQRLTELLGLSFNEVDPNSQAIQQPLGAFRSAQSRATDRARMAMALRNQNQGISGGGEDVGLLGLLEEQGQNEAGFEADLITRELATQRQQLTNAIELATQAGLQNRARELQGELGKLDLKLREMLGKGQLALGQQQLSQQDRQFLESLGFNYANLQSQMNNNAIEALLG